MEINKEKLIDAVVRLQKGDGKAFEDLYNLTYNAARFTALKITKNEQDAEDVLQDSYIKVLEKINTIDKPESFMSWFNMTVANKARDLMRKSKPGLFSDYEKENEDGDSFSVIDTIEEDNPEYIPGEDVEKEELRKDMMKLIEGLSDEKRAAVILFYYNEMSIKDIASALNISEGTVKSRLFNAKKELAVGVEKLKKSGKLLGVAPMSVVSWAIKASSAAAGTTYSGAAAATFTAVTASSAATAAGIGTAAAAGGTAAAGAGVVTKIIAAVVAVAVVGGGVVAGTKAVKDKKSNQQTTTYSVSETKQTEKSSEKDTTSFTDRYDEATVPDGKLTDTLIGRDEGKYGVIINYQDYVVKNADGTEVVRTKPIYNRGGFKATYEELVPGANENAKKYSSQANTLVSLINEARRDAGLKEVKIDNVLTEQANVRAEEMAWSGKISSQRPDNTSYTTVFDHNGLTDGTRIEIRVAGYSSPGDVIKIVKSNSNFRNAASDRIGVGVAQNLTSEELIYVIHLYSEEESFVMENSELQNAIDDKSEEIEQAEKDLIQGWIDRLEEFDEQGSDGSVISEILNYDFHNDSLMMLIKQLNDRLLQIKQVTDDRLSNLR